MMNAHPNTGQPIEAGRTHWPISRLLSLVHSCRPFLRHIRGRFTVTFRPVPSISRLSRRISRGPARTGPASGPCRRNHHAETADPAAGSQQEHSYRRRGRAVQGPGYISRLSSHFQETRLRGGTLRSRANVPGWVLSGERAARHLKQQAPWRCQGALLFPKSKHNVSRCALRVLVLSGSTPPR